MNLYNLNKNATLPLGVKVAAGFFSRLKGLMFTDESDFPKGKALLLYPCSAIHSFFMRFDIDVVFLEKIKYNDSSYKKKWSGRYKVAGFLKKMKPYRFSPWVFGAKAVLEYSSTNDVAVDVGDVLELREENKSEC